MNQRQRALMAGTADLVAQGSEWWREAADAMADGANALAKARDAATPGEAEALTRLLMQVRRLASNFDQAADRFAEMAAQMQPYQRNKL